MRFSASSMEARSSGGLWGGSAIAGSLFAHGVFIAAYSVRISVFCNVRVIEEGGGMVVLKEIKNHSFSEIGVCELCIYWNDSLGIDESLQYRSRLGLSTPQGGMGFVTPASMPIFGAEVRHK